MARIKGLGKSLLLLILIVIMVLFGIWWFDFIGVISAKKVTAPIFSMLGLEKQTSQTVSGTKEFVDVDQDNLRFRKRIESMDAREESLNKREADIKLKEDANAQIAQELEDRINSQTEREKTFNNLVKKYDDRRVNIEQIVSKLNSMPPASAVGILNQMDDQLIIDVWRFADELSAANGSTSMVSVWQMNMTPDRVAQINRKMTNKPNSIQ